MQTLSNRAVRCPAGAAFSNGVRRAPLRAAVPASRRQAVVTRASSEDVGAAGTAAIALGLAANPILLWSDFTLATTGAGLPEGPNGLLGAAEGVSYLVVLGIIGWSAYTKFSTGSGLPAGPSGLLGAVEGLSYLSLLGAIVAFGIKSFS